MSNEPIIIVIPGAPIAKGRPRHRIVQPNGGKAYSQTYTPAKTRRYEDDIRQYAGAAMQGRLLLEGAIDLRIRSYRPIPTSFSKKKRADAIAGLLRPVTKPDWDNYGKISDALNGIVWRDDAQVVDGMVRKYFSEQPRLQIEIRSL